MKIISRGLALSVFELSVVGSALAAPTETVLHTFKGSSDGDLPEFGVAADSKGNLYGTTYAGGTNQVGVVFELSPSTTVGGTWTETVLHSFGPDLQHPTAGVIAESKGNLYGTISDSVFELSPPASVGGTWTETVLYRFSGGAFSGGVFPTGGLIADSKGNLYGTTTQGGAADSGAVFELSPPANAGGTWTETVLHYFVGYPKDGGIPEAGIISDNKGNLYGTTINGGASNAGVVFELSPPTTVGGTWTETVLHTFIGADGAYPYAGLVLDSKGNLYGTTYYGGGASVGQNGYGVVFELSPPAVTGGTWTGSVLHTFTGGEDGNSASSLIIDSKGNLYGTTPVGGAQNEGLVFELSSPTAVGGTWTKTVLYSFTGGQDGGAPEGGLLADSKGNLFGTTAGGGSVYQLSGVVYELTGTGFVTETPFAAFRSNLELQFGRRPNTDAFELLSEFTLGSTSSGINPLTDPLTLTIGTYTATLPAGSFRRERNGQFIYAGQTNGADLKAAIAQTGEKRFEFAAGGRKADLAGTTNPVPVTLTIGNNTGTDSIKHPQRGW